MYEFLAFFKQPPLLRDVSETGFGEQPGGVYTKLRLALRPDTPALRGAARASTIGQFSFTANYGLSKFDRRGEHPRHLIMSPSDVSKVVNIGFK